MSDLHKSISRSLRGNKPTANSRWVTTRSESIWDESAQRYVTGDSEGYWYDGDWSLAHTVLPVWATGGWRFRYDDGSEAGATWIAAESVDAPKSAGIFPGSSFRFRVAAGETAKANTNNTGGWQLQFSKNSGTWTSVGAATDISYFDSTFVTDNESTSQRVTAAAGTTYTSGFGAVTELGIDNGETYDNRQGMENEYVLQAHPTNTAEDDVFEFRLLDPEGNVATLAGTPSLTLNTPTVIEQDHFRWYANDNSDVDLTTALAAEDTTFEAAISDIGTTAFHLRVSLSNIGFTATEFFRLQFRRDGNPSPNWRTIQTITSEVDIAAGLPTDLDPVSQLLTAGTGTYEDGIYKDNDPNYIDQDITQDFFTEHVWCIQFQTTGNDGLQAESYEFRVIYNDLPVTENVSIVATIAGPSADNISELPSDVLSLADFDPQTVTTENANPNTSGLPGDALTLDDFDPQAVTTEKNISLLAAAALVLATFAPQAVATENVNPNTSQLPSDTLTLTNYAPQAVTTENANPNTSQLPSDALTLSGSDPQIIITEQNFSALGKQDLVLTAYAPTVVSANPQTSQVPSDALILTTYPPQTVTTENTNPNTSQLVGILNGGFETGDLSFWSNDLAVTSVSSANPRTGVYSALTDASGQSGPGNVSALFSNFYPIVANQTARVELWAARNEGDLPSHPLTAAIAFFDSGLGLVGSAFTTTPADETTVGYQRITVEGIAPATATTYIVLLQWLVPLAEGITGQWYFDDVSTNFPIVLAGFDPQVVTTENANPDTSQLPSDTLVLTGYDPQAVTTEGADADTSQLPSDTLVLTGYDPQAVTTENNRSGLPSQALLLTAFAPSAATFDPNTSQLPSDTLTLTGHDPSAVTTEGADADVSQLPFQALALDEFDPQAVTTENANPNTSQLANDTLILDDFDPQAVTTENANPNTSQLPSDVLTLGNFDPQAVTTEGVDTNTSQLPSDVLSLADFDPQAITTEIANPNTSQLPSNALTLTGYDPQAVTSDVVADPNTSELPVAAVVLNPIVPILGTAGVLPASLDDVTYVNASTAGDLVAECMGFDISADGTKLFACTEDYLIRSWDLSPAWDITNPTNLQTSAVISSGNNWPRDLQWSPDGLTLFVLLYENGQLSKQTVTIPYDISQLDATWDQNFDFGSNHRAFYMSGDGTRLLLNFSENFQVTYSMSPAYDLTSMTQIKFQTTLGPQGDLVAADDGLSFWMTPRDSNVVNQYTMSPAWNIDLAALGTPVLTLNSATAGSYSLFYRGDRAELYVGYYGQVGVNDCIIEKYSWASGGQEYAPTIITTENTNSNVCQLPSDTLTVSGFDPIIEVSEPGAVALPSDVLTLVGHAPQTVVTENTNPSISQLPSDALVLTTSVPEVIVTETGQEVSQLPSAALSISGFDPNVTTTENANPNDTQLPVADLTLTTGSPTIAVTRRILIIT